mgnify:FL=1
MTVKVGDIVRYHGQDVRVMRCYSNNTRVSHFGFIRTVFDDSDIIESDKAPIFEVGDQVLVGAIPLVEQRAYGPGWVKRMNKMVNNIYTVDHIRYDTERGPEVLLNSLWFQTYHLEPINDFDII